MDKIDIKRWFLWLGIFLLSLIALSAFFMGLAAVIEFFMPQADFGAEVNAAILIGAVSALVPAAVGFATIYITYKINKQTQDLTLQQLRQNQLNEVWKKRLEVYLELTKLIDFFKERCFDCLPNARKPKRSEQEKAILKEAKSKMHIKLHFYVKDHRFFISEDLYKQVQAFLAAAKTEDLFEGRMCSVKHKKEDGQEQLIEFTTYANTIIISQMQKDLGLAVLNTDMQHLFNNGIIEEKQP